MRREPSATLFSTHDPRRCAYALLLVSLGLFLALHPDEGRSNQARSSPGGIPFRSESARPWRVLEVRSSKLDAYDEASNSFYSSLSAYHDLMMDSLVYKGESTFLLLESRISPSFDAAAPRGSASPNGERTPDLLLTLGSAATRAALALHPDIPIVYCMVLNAEKVTALPEEGVVMGGVSMDIPIRGQVNALADAFPRARSLGILSGVLGPKRRAAFAEAAAARGLETTIEQLRDTTRAATAIRMLIARSDVILADGAAIVYSAEVSRFLLLHTLRTGRPLMGLMDGLVRSGALLGITVDYAEQGIQAAEIARIALQQKGVHSLPRLSPGSTRILLNMRTARRIGVHLPDAFLDSAIKVVP